MTPKSIEGELYRPWSHRVQHTTCEPRLVRLWCRPMQLHDCDAWAVAETQISA